MNRIIHLSFLLSVLFIAGCASEEYTSAKLYLQQKDFAKAEEFLVKAMAVEPDNPEIPFQLGHQIYGKDGRWKEMNEAFDKALAINPDAKILDGRTVKEFVKIARYQYWTEVYNQGVQTYNSTKGLNEEERKNAINKAVDLFNTAVDIRPDESLDYTMLATCYYELGDPDKSAELILKAVSMAPDDFNANMAAGQILSRNHQSEKALPFFKKAVELEPNNSAAIRNLAQTYYDTGDRKSSIDTYELAIKATPDNKIKADLHFNLGLLYSQTDEYDAAEDHFTTALDLNPDDLEAILGMAQTFERIEKWRKAEKFYKELIYQQPDEPSYYRRLSVVLLQQGKQKEAKKYLDKAKKLE